ncbi:MAG: ribosome silencing factor [Verrucomicrobia bacterium]|nr:MAG: ribosome silencing factor [Verrucomicrobiota bacterium]
MDIRKLQRITVEALEDVKAKDIEVINTTKLTSLFDRIIVASGDSNRQVKALARSVADAVREAGGTVIGTEGEGSGEWVLVDLGDIVVHVMQPAVRTYYNIEELWTGSSTRPKGKLQRAAVEDSATEEAEPAAPATPAAKPKRARAPAKAKAV